MCLDAGDCRGVEVGKISLENTIDQSGVKRWEVKCVEKGRIANGFLFSNRGQRSLGILNRYVNVGPGRKIAKLVYRKGTTLDCRDGGTFYPQFGIVSLDPFHEVLKLLVQRDALRTKDQFMKILALI
jgi:hypothetical protein